LLRGDRHLKKSLARKKKKKKKKNWSKKIVKPPHFGEKKRKA